MWLENMPLCKSLVCWNWMHLDDVKLSTNVQVELKHSLRWAVATPMPNTSSLRHTPSSAFSLRPHKPASPLTSMRDRWTCKVQKDVQKVKVKVLSLLLLLWLLITPNLKLASHLKTAPLCLERRPWCPDRSISILETKAGEIGQDQKSGKHLYSVLLHMVRLSVLSFNAEDKYSGRDSLAQDERSLSWISGWSAQDCY